MMDVHSREFQDQFARDAAVLSERVGTVQVEMGVVEAMAMIGHIQLAMRHPCNRGESALAAGTVVRRLIDALGQTEVLRRGLLAGNDERHDAPWMHSPPGSSVRAQRVALIGSSRFKRLFEEVGRREELCGRVALHMAFFGHADGIDITPAEREVLDRVDRDRIDFCDHVLVINGDGYVGEHTAAELAYARQRRKRVRWWQLPSRHALPGEGE